MNKVLDLRLRRFVPVGLIALAAAVLLAPTADATPFVVNVVQSGGNVIANGNGEFDLSGLSYISPWGGFTSAMAPAGSMILISTESGGDGYTGYSGPASFGSAVFTPATTATGDAVGINRPVLYVPAGYTSGTALSDSATWDNATFASLGVTPGTYVWSWGSAADQTFTLIIGNAISAPEPAEFGMFGLGLLLIGGFVGLRRRAE